MFLPIASAMLLLPLFERILLDVLLKAVKRHVAAIYLQELTVSIVYVYLRQRSVKESVINKTRAVHTDVYRWVLRCVQQPGKFSQVRPHYWRCQ